MYKTDWKLVRDQTATAAGFGALFGAMIGASRLRSAPQYALVAAAQVGLFSGSDPHVRRVASQL